MKINRGDSQDKGSQSRQAYHAAPAPAPKRPVQPDPDPQDLYEDAEGPDEYAEDDDDEPVRRRFPIGLVVLVVILAIVGIGGWKVFQFYGEVAGNGELGPEQTVTIEQGSTVADITNVLKEMASSSMTGCSSCMPNTAAALPVCSMAISPCAPAWIITRS